MSLQHVIFKITNHLFQLVSKWNMTHAYCTVTIRYIAHSYWQALIYSGVCILES